MSNQEAFNVFKALRWGADNHVTCPCCGVVAKQSTILKQWRLEYISFAATSAQEAIE